MATEPWIKAPHQLAGKLDNEGGVIGALEYGITPEHFTDAPEVADLKRLWAELQAAYAPVEPIVAQIEDLAEVDW